MITIHEYSDGETIFREGDEGGTAYIIDQGQVTVTKQFEGQEVHLARLGAGEIFGEMSLIEERPHSATVRAVGQTLIREIPREEFSTSLKKDPQAAMSLLKVLFERLREANATILQLQKESPQGCRLSSPLSHSANEHLKQTIFMKGLTLKAAQALPTNPFNISKFPFRIGRTSFDPLATNDLMIPDSEPYQISIHHVSIVQTQDGIGISDRGSRLGSLLNGRQLGGQKGNPKPLLLNAQEGILVLGNLHSPYKYKLTIEPL